MLAFFLFPSFLEPFLSLCGVVFFRPFFTVGISRVVLPLRSQILAFYLSFTCLLDSHTYPALLPHLYSCHARALGLVIKPKQRVSNGKQEVIFDSL
jgi:hypothetical protein